jgi:hypothetical protein
LLNLNSSRQSLSGWRTNHNNAVADIFKAHGSGAYRDISTYPDSLACNRADTKPAARPYRDISGKVSARTDMHGGAKPAIVIDRCASVDDAANSNVTADIHDCTRRDHRAGLQPSIATDRRFRMYDDGDFEAKGLRALQKPKAQICTANGNYARVVIPRQPREIVEFSDNLPRPRHGHLGIAVIKKGDLIPIFRRYLRSIRDHTAMAARARNQ